MLGSRSVLTLPFADFEATAVARLSMTRTYSSNGGFTFDALPSIFGPGWRHEWEVALTCEDDRCTVGRGGKTGLSFKKAETAVSLDGAEILQIYRATTEGRSSGQRDLLVRRPNGEWILHESDGATMHFESICDGACQILPRLCSSPEAGGIARLVKRVDSQGNAVHVRYAPGEGVLIGLSDDLGHSLEVRSDTPCVQKARWLYYDGLPVASYSYVMIDDGFGGLIEGTALEAARDSDGAVLRSYSYQFIQGEARGNVGSVGPGFPLLTGIFDESGGLNVEFAYEGYRATGISDQATTMTIVYGDDDVATVTESFGTGTSSCQRTFDQKGTLLSVTEGCSDGPARDFTYAGGERICTRDSAGNVTYDGRDALGRLVRYAKYSGAISCPPPSTLGSSFLDERRAYGVTKQVAQGVDIELDRLTSVSRTSTLSTANKTIRSWDYDPAPKSYDPVGYECAEAPLPAGAVVCRYLESGYVTTSTGWKVLERHATFYDLPPENWTV